MSKLLISITAFLCLVDIAEAQQSPVAGVKPVPGYEIVVYPEEVYFGDPVYIGIRLKNISEEEVSYYTSGYCREYFWLSLLSDSITVPYHLLHEYLAFWSPHYAYREPPSHFFQTGESVLVLVAYQELPALEDMNFPFWKEAKKRLESGESIVTHIGMECRSRDGKQPPEPNYEYVSQPLLIKPRPASEMELVQNWLEGTPEKLRPAPFDQIVVEGRYFLALDNLKDEFDAIPLTPKPGFVSKERSLKINRNDRLSMASNERFIKVQGNDYFPYYFVRHGNRKPGDPVCPETWQGWQELEESITPSTMRDEIRLTRMLIQYCDTQDKTVLDELKKWLTDMNELQRWSMINSVLDKAKKGYEGKDILKSSFRDLYHAIREYDIISAKSESDIEWLKQLGLLE